MLDLVNDELKARESFNMSRYLEGNRSNGSSSEYTVSTLLSVSASTNSRGSLDISLANAFSVRKTIGQINAQLLPTCKERRNFSGTESFVSVTWKKIIQVEILKGKKLIFIVRDYIIK